ncbi:hypothetical protein QBC46DRAFT_352343 [Diplogelasinospora grovesii]|uniref:Uncharacterized protein n=1 Tax=Diplogelasinospora grovesii TaxID=303347 RepID=A0AAN6NBH4_9PEZI|nr:hypothetical protein QBC46DRAFT_352343 [Diplogelasinospora grovesii]
MGLFTSARSAAPDPDRTDMLSELALKDTHNDLSTIVIQLATLLRLPVNCGVARPAEAWLTHQAGVIKESSKARGNKRTLSPVLLRAPKWKRLFTSQQKHAATLCTLCPAHAGLSSEVIGFCFYMLRIESASRLDIARNFCENAQALKEVGLVTEETAEEIRHLVERLTGLATLYMPCSVFSHYYGDGVRSEYMYSKVESGCAACTLSIIGTRADLLIALRANMLARENQRASKAKTPRLLRLIDAWVDLFDGGNKRDYFRGESQRIGDMLVEMRRIMKENRHLLGNPMHRARSRKGKGKGKGRGGGREKKLLDGVAVPKTRLTEGARLTAEEDPFADALGEYEAKTSYNAPSAVPPPLNTDPKNPYSLNGRRGRFSKIPVVPPKAPSSKYYSPAVVVVEDEVKARRNEDGEWEEIHDHDHDDSDETGSYVPPRKNWKPSTGLNPIYQNPNYPHLNLKNKGSRNGLRPKVSKSRLTGKPRSKAAGGGGSSTYSRPMSAAACSVYSQDSHSPSHPQRPISIAASSVYSQDGGRSPEFSSSAGRAKANDACDRTSQNARELETRKAQIEAARFLEEQAAKRGRSNASGSGSGSRAESGTRGGGSSSSSKGGKSGSGSGSGKKGGWFTGESSMYDRIDEEQGEEEEGTSYVYDPDDYETIVPESTLVGGGDDDDDDGKGEEEWESVLPDDSISHAQFNHGR